MSSILIVDSIQTAAGATTGFSIAMATALG